MSRRHGKAESGILAKILQKQLISCTFLGMAFTDQNDVAQIPVTLRTARGNTSSGEIQLCTWDKKTRTARGARAWAMTWGGAIVAVFIPIVHFILVPLLLLGGPMMFFIFTSEKQIVLGGEGKCPDCGQRIAIVRAPVKWPLSDMCNHCQASIKVELVSA